MEEVNPDMVVIGNFPPEKEDEAKLRRRVAVAIGGMGVKATSMATGIPTGTLEKYAAQTATPSIVRAAKIARATGVRLEELAYGRAAAEGALDASRLAGALELVLMWERLEDLDLDIASKVRLTLSAYAVLAEDTPEQRANVLREFRVITGGKA